MSESNAWQHLVNLKPSLPRHAEFQQRQYQGETWHLLHDKASGKFHRFNGLAYRLIGFMNGRNNLAQILASASQSRLQQTLDETPTREDLIQLIQYLYVADLLVCDIPARSSDIFERQQKKRQQHKLQFIRSPYAWKIPLFNPDSLLTRLQPLGKILTSPAMGIIWLTCVTYGLLLAMRNWPQLTSSQFNELFSGSNLILLWLTYPALKVFHELGHGLFTKAWGGRVHEFGVVFIVGTPFPYVDATAATGFNSKKQRMMVGAAGMAVELFFAAVAMILWVDAEPGIYKNVLFNIILIGSVSTLFFNGNPLMRFDGYHILCDALDQPNLATRAQLQLSYLVKRFAYGVDLSLSPTKTTGEAIGLTSYALAAIVYRLSVLLTIVTVVVSRAPLPGLLLGIWLLLFQLLLPLAKNLTYLFFNKELQHSRKRAIAISFTALFTVATFVLFVPLPDTTRAEGVLWLPENARVRAPVSGLVTQQVVADGQHITAGQSLLQLTNLDITAELLQKQATLREYQARYQQAWSLDRAQIQMFEEDIKAITAEIEFLQERVNNLIVRSPASGRFRVLTNHQLPGSFVKEGDTLGLLLNGQAPVIRVALDQETVNHVRRDTRSIKVQFASELGRSLKGELAREVPGGTFELPSPILGAAGGGSFAVQGKENNTRTLERVFILDIAFPQTQGETFFGQRVFVSFIHQPRPLGARLYARLQQLLVRLARGDRLISQ